jgi:hypothetical protein
MSSRPIINGGAARWGWQGAGKCGRERRHRVQSCRRLEPRGSIENIARRRSSASAWEMSAATRPGSRRRNPHLSLPRKHPASGGAPGRRLDGGPQGGRSGVGKGILQLGALVSRQHLGANESRRTPRSRQRPYNIIPVVAHAALPPCASRPIRTIGRSPPGGPTPRQKPAS